MGLSTCPGCGATIEHGDDAAEFNQHILDCPRLKASGLGPTGSTSLDLLWEELQEAAKSPGGVAVKEAIEKFMHPLLSFDGSVQDYLTLGEDVPMQTFLKILAMVPSIVGIVKQTEDTIVGPGKGPDKLSLVLNTVNAAVSAVPEVQQSFAGHDLNGTVAAIVAGAVTAMNSAKGSGQAT